jgi:hypothetical protein
LNHLPNDLRDVSRATLAVTDRAVETSDQQSDGEAAIDDSVSRGTGECQWVEAMHRSQPLVFPWNPSRVTERRQGRGDRRATSWPSSHWLGGEPMPPSHAELGNVTERRPSVASESIIVLLLRNRLSAYTAGVDCRGSVAFDASSRREQELEV